MRAVSLVFALLVAHARAYDEVYMTCLVNAQRAAVGLSALGIDSRLTNAAQSHSNWQASMGVMSHTGAGGSGPGDRIEAAGYNWLNMGENVAFGYDGLDSVMDAWMNSQGHRENILSPSFRMMGSAMALSSSGTPYYSQEFGNDGSAATNIPDCSGGRRTTTPAPAPAPATTTAPANNLTPVDLGLTPIQPATDGAPSNGPTGPIVIVVNGPSAAPEVAVAIPANSSPVNVQSASATPAPAPAPAPAVVQPISNNSTISAALAKPSASTTTAANTVSAASVPSSGGGSMFAPHELSNTMSSAPVAASSIVTPRLSPFSPHEMVQV